MVLDKSILSLSDTDLAAHLRASTDEDLAGLARSVKQKNKRKVKVQKAVKAAGEKRKRIAPEDSAALRDRLVGAVHANPGNGIGDYAKELGVEVKILSGLAVKGKAIKDGLIHFTGSRRMAVYYPGKPAAETTEDATIADAAE